MQTPRIIGGKARGRRLKDVPGDITRPITDRAKESLFNIIGNDIQDASLLDLFAGTGSVGIEALSRGAAFVRFVEVSRVAAETVRANLEATGLQAGAEIHRGDAFSLLRSRPDRQYDYVFIAPPQYKGMWKQALDALDENPGWLAEDCWVIVQIDLLEYQPGNYLHFTEFDQRKYGKTLFVFYQPEIEN
jgi:16S rRNA (guanine(966)-N(2))-methyltransferase RsmD